MILNKILLSVSLLALVGILFFLPAAFLVEKKGGLNGQKSKLRNGVSACVVTYIVFVILRVIYSGTVELPDRQPGNETLYLVSGGISSLASFAFLGALISVWKLLRKKNTIEDNQKWLRLSLWFWGLSMILFGIGLVLSNL